jgi:beta-barrel assembly-enhancing protease
MQSVSMKRILIEGLLIIVMFLGSWFLLNQINWMKVFGVETMTQKTEQKLGDKLWEWFQKTDHEVTDTVILNSVDSLLTRICQNNNIDKSILKLHILQNPEVNAMALPGSHLVMFTGLLAETQNPEELCGVLCHEMAHIKLNHVTQKLIKEVGLSVLVSITTGNNSGQILKETAHLLSSTAFDRRLEKEADLVAVNYLLMANISPEPFARFLNRLAENEPDNFSKFTWINTHPDTQKRAEQIMDRAKNETVVQEVILAVNTWSTLKEHVNRAQTTK